MASLRHGLSRSGIATCEPELSDKVEHGQVNEGYVDQLVESHALSRGEPLTFQQARQGAWEKTVEEKPLGAAHVKAPKCCEHGLEFEMGKKSTLVDLVPCGVARSSNCYTSSSRSALCVHHPHA